MGFSIKTISIGKLLILLMIGMFFSSQSFANSVEGVNKLNNAINNANGKAAEAFSKPSEELTGATNALNKASGNIAGVTNQVDTMGNALQGTAGVIGSSVGAIGGSVGTITNSVTAIGGSAKALGNTAKSVFGIFGKFKKKKGYQYKHSNGSENCIVLLSDSKNISQMRVNIKGSNNVKDIRKAFNKCAKEYKEAKVSVSKLNFKDGSWNGGSYTGRSTGAEIVNRSVEKDGLVEYQFVVSFPDNVTEKKANVASKISEAKRVALILLNQLAKRRDAKLVVSSL